MVHQGRGLQARLQHDARAPRHQGQSAGRRQRRRGRHPRLRRRLRCLDGQRTWRFWTVPAPGEPGYKRGRRAGSLKIAGRPEADPPGSPVLTIPRLIWFTGASEIPGPDWNADSRPGDNLYTCSLVALDGNTGALKWHFQFTPHDTHDWDSTHVPVLFEAEVRGVKRKLVAVANRNAFFYVLDRSSGEFIAGRAYAKQTWAKGLDDRGRPMVIPNTEPSAEGTMA